MTELNQADIKYATDQRSRLGTRLLISFFVGIFASWMWLIIICVIWALLESVTMAKVLRSNDPRSNSDDPKERAHASGKAKGEAFVYCIPVAVSVIFVASIFKLLKIGVIWIFETLMS